MPRQKKKQKSKKLKWPLADPKTGENINYGIEATINAFFRLFDKAIEKRKPIKPQEQKTESPPVPVEKPKRSVFLKWVSDID